MDPVFTIEVEIDAPDELNMWQGWSTHRYHETDVAPVVTGPQERAVRPVGFQVFAVNRTLDYPVAVPVHDEGFVILPADVGTGITYAVKDGVFHGQVLSGMGRIRVQHTVLRKRKSAGEKDACSQNQSFHITL